MAVILDERWKTSDFGMMDDQCFINNKNKNNQNVIRERERESARSFKVYEKLIEIL